MACMLLGMAGGIIFCNNERDDEIEYLSFITACLNQRAVDLVGFDTASKLADDLGEIPGFPTTFFDEHPDLEEWKEALSHGQNEKYN